MRAVEPKGIVIESAWSGTSRSCTPPPLAAAAVGVVGVVGVVTPVPTRSSKEDVGWPGGDVGGEFL